MTNDVGRVVADELWLRDTILQVSVPEAVEISGSFAVRGSGCRLIGTTLEQNSYYLRAGSPDAYLREQSARLQQFLTREQAVLESARVLPFQAPALRDAWSLTILERDVEEGIAFVAGLATSTGVPYEFTFESVGSNRRCRESLLAFVGELRPVDEAPPAIDSVRERDFWVTPPDGFRVPVRRDYKLAPRVPFLEAVVTISVPGAMAEGELERTPRNVLLHRQRGELGCWVEERAPAHRAIADGTLWSAAAALGHHADPDEPGSGEPEDEFSVYWWGSIRKSNQPGVRYVLHARGTRGSYRGSLLETYEDFVETFASSVMGRARPQS